MVDFIAQDDNLLSKEECTNIIRWTLKNKDLENSKADFAGYQFTELMDYPHKGGDFHKDLSPKPLQPIKRAIDKYWTRIRKNIQWLVENTWMVGV